MTEARTFPYLEPLPVKYFLFSRLLFAPESIVATEIFIISYQESEGKNAQTK